MYRQMNGDLVVSRAIWWRSTMWRQVVHPRVLSVEGC